MEKRRRGETENWRQTEFETAYRIPHTEYLIPVGRN